MFPKISAHLKKIKILVAISIAAVMFLTVNSGFCGIKVMAYDKVFCNASNEKNKTIDLTDKQQGYSAVLYDNTNGLPTSEANAIAQTSEGFIWIGSYSGLIRYDGNTFERIDSTFGISSVVSLYVDRKNRLWIGTNDSGVAVMDNGKVTLFNKSDGLKSSSVRAILEDSHSNIYVATTHGIVIIDKNMKLQAVDEPQINEEYIRSIMLGSDDVIYGITLKGAVFTMKDGKLTGYFDNKKLGVEDAHSILPDADNPGYVYIGTKFSKIYYGELQSGFKNSKVMDVSPLGYINDMNNYDDKLWICSDNGIGILEKDELTIVENVPMNNSVDHLLRDYQGNMWFVSTRQGVMKIVPNQFTDIFDKYDIPATVVNSTCMCDDILFIGTDNGLIAVDNSGIVENVPVTSAADISGEVIETDNLVEFLKGKRIRSIIRDRKNRLWFSTFGANALVRYEKGKLTRFSTDDGLPSDRIRTVFECADGTFLVACTGGVCVIKDDAIREVYDESSGISNVEVLTVTENENGDIIVGTDGDGIYIINDAKTIHLGTESGLSSEVIMRIKKDLTRDIFWIVSSNSIAYMDSKYKIHTIKKFPYSNNFDMYENSNGEMWVLSSNGVYITTVEELIANEEIITAFYGKGMGLSCITTSNSYSEITDEGDLYIAGTTGVAKVNIEVPFEDVNDLKMAVPYVEADGVRIYADDSGAITVPAKTKKLTIFGYVYTYSLMNPQVTYYLEGFEHKKTTVRRTELGSVDYTNLSGGKYHFIMQLKDAQGNGYKELSVLIIKKKAIHEMLWFKILMVILVLFIIGVAVMGYIYHRTKVFLRKEQENKLLVREIVEAFAKTIDMKDKYTNGHSSRVAEYTAMLTRELGYDEETIEKYYNIALLHDIGKIGVPSSVLNKEGKLTDDEFKIIKSHSMLGYNVLKDISIMPELATGAGAHHERPDGKGYPRGMKGEEIPRVAQIIAVADTFDAMYSDRPYRKRMNFEKVVSIMREVSGTQLAGDVVDAFLRLVDKGEFIDPEDDGGGTLEDIDNIHKKFVKDSE